MFRCPPRSKNVSVSESIDLIHSVNHAAGVSPLQQCVDLLGGPVKRFGTTKTKCAASSKLKAAQSVFLYSTEAFAPTAVEACAPTFAEASTSASYKMAAPHVHTGAADFVSR